VSVFKDIFNKNVFLKQNYYRYIMELYMPHLLSY